MRHLTQKWIAIVGVLLLCTLVGNARAADETATTSGSGTIQILDVGNFEVYICPHASNTTNFVHSFWSNPRSPGVTSYTGEEAVGRLTICYLDTARDREAFTVTLSASNFVSQTEGVTSQIDASNLSMYRTMAVRLQNVNETPTSNPEVGAIYSTSPDAEHVYQPWNNDLALNWSPGHSLQTPQQIARGEEGAGISVGREGQGQNRFTARQTVYMVLFVPPGTPPATYQTTITLNVSPVQEP